MLRPVHPEATDAFDPRSPEGRDRLLELYRPPHDEWLRLNFVTSVSGSAAGPDGTSETLTSAADRLILGVIRELADVVLVGAASVRAEGYKLPKRSRLAVLTATGNLSGHRLGDDVRGLLIVGPASARANLPSEWAHVEFLTVPGEGTTRAVDIVSALRENGLRSIVCEGGPALATQLLAASLVDELCLTTSPLVTGTDLPLFGGHSFAAARTSLDGMLLGDDGSVFTRWGVKEALPATD